MSNTRYEDFLRSRITELRLQKNVSEHKMSLDLDKSGSYIRGITSGIALPSREDEAFTEKAMEALHRPAVCPRAVQYHRLF